MAPSTIHTLIFGGLGLISVSFLVYFMFWRKPASTFPAIKDKDAYTSNKPLKEVEKKVEKHAEKASADTVKKAEPAPVSAPEFVVEDAESDEEEEEENEAEVTTIDNEIEELQTKYDDANRLAKKLIAGESYEKAIVKLTEALELAPRIPGAGKDIMTLYNNRSAMYEKLGQYEKSLSDITVILAMDPLHAKARVRRARIFEAQDKHRQALDEYMLSALDDQRKGVQSAHQPKIEALAKTVAAKSYLGLFKSLRASSKDRPLPSKSHSKNFLESYPSVHLWVDHYKNIERETLVAALESALAAYNTDAPEDTVALDTQLRAAQLSLIAYDFVNTRFETAFKLLHTMKAATADPSLPTHLHENVAVAYVLPYNNTDTLQLLSLQYEFIGFEKQLRCDLVGAAEAFTTALRFYPQNYDVRLKLANVYHEQPNLEKCEEIFSELLAHFDRLDLSVNDKDIVDILKAWTLLHKISIYVSRNDENKYSETAISDSVRDVEEALKLTEALENTLAGKAARVTALIRSVHIVVQSKPMVGETVTEEDADNCKAAVAQAKKLAPDNDSVMMLEAELLNNEGRADEALALIVASQQRPDAIEGDCTPYCLRASILINKAMTLLNTATSQQDVDDAKALFGEAKELYKQGLEKEPNAIEALNQYAQYCGMVGDLDVAVEMLNKALPLARTRDDVHDLNQVLVMHEAQLKAIMTMNKLFNQ